jgi:hypothetical protein
MSASDPTLSSEKFKSIRESNSRCNKNVIDFQIIKKKAEERSYWNLAIIGHLTIILGLIAAKPLYDNLSDFT